VNPPGEVLVRLVLGQVIASATKGSTIVKIISGKRWLLPALGAFGTSVFLAAPAAAEPSPKPAAAAVTFSYEAPRISADGTAVTWKWTLTNKGSAAAGNVVLMHSLTPQLKIGKTAKECTAGNKGVTCSYGTVDAGGKKEGMLVAVLPRDQSGTVDINGRVVWLQGATQPARVRHSGAGSSDEARS
jgi:hypothetical protein